MKATIPAASCAKDIAIKVRLTGMRRMRLRFFLMSKLFLFAAWVGGVGQIDVEMGDSP